MRHAGAQFLWLEDMASERTKSWVAGENARTLARFDENGQFSRALKQASEVLLATDNVAALSLRAAGVDEIWHDETHQSGVWRHCSLGDFQRDQPCWRDLLDLDELCAREGKQWVWRGVTALPTDEERCLLRLSEGGSDAIRVIEFDTAEARFVENGFRLDGLHNMSGPWWTQEFDWVDADTLILADRTYLTRSSLPYVLRLWRRGEAFSGAREIFKGTREDLAVLPRVLRDTVTGQQLVLFERHLDIFQHEIYALGKQAPLRLDLPLTTHIKGLVNGQLIFTVQEDWRQWRAGALLSQSADLGNLHQGEVISIWEPPSGEALDVPSTPISPSLNVVASGSCLIAQTLRNVTGNISIFRPKPGGWTRATVALPPSGSLKIRAVNSLGQALVMSEDFLEPSRLWLVDMARADARLVRQTRAVFDAAKSIVEQFWATSSDGEKVPYFIVRPRSQRRVGETPTLIYAYGGFMLSRTPTYDPLLGRLWLEQGGAYVLANIRGGSEFGPNWHSSVMRENRQLAFDDLIAVADDLIARKFTRPSRLGIYGESNGGLLVSVALTQRPELFGAVVIENPLIDVRRYSLLFEGRAWVAEYGDPENAEDWEFLRAYAPYEAIRPARKYPEPFVTSNAGDDRVHPAHARKFVALLQESGSQALYYEDTVGGHDNDSSPQLIAAHSARRYVYLAQKLMGHAT